ncbi:MAG TPA: hypothetical protein VFU90_14235, partial [Candidatus Tumulicola sp.]|nr:hypothetical protein [Candidatus Tumulicola sp.]
MLTRRRALFRLLAAMVAVNAGCDFGGSNTPATEPDLTLDGRSDAATAHDAARDALADAPSETRPADGAIEAAVVTDAGATIDAAEAAAIDAGAIVDAASDVAPPPAVEAGIDATVDAGIDAGVDAASVVVVDAADADARDAAPAPVAVTISGPTGPESGAPVVFHDPSGTQLGVVTTDSTGAASMLVPPGSMVTAIFGNPNSSVLVSIAAVQPGDVIPIVDPAPAISLVASPTIHLPDSAPPSGTTQYELVVGGSCGSTVSSSTSTVTVDVES